MISTVSHASQSLMPFVLGMTIMVGVILVSYLLCTLPAIVVQELHSRGRSFDRVILPLFLRRVKIYSKNMFPCNQALIPTYIINWLTALLNPVIYVVCNPTIR